MAETDRPTWYVIYAHTRKENEVKNALEQQGLEIFLPLVTIPSRRRDRKVTLQTPLFPGYLFIKTRLDTEVFHKIIKTNHVFRILGEGKPASITETEVESIKAIVCGDRPFYRWRFLRKGKKVRVLEGPLAGVEGTILKTREQKCRLVVGVELFQRSVAVELDNDAVECV